MKLRDYQTTLLERIAGLIATGEMPLVTMPTGSGKGTVAAALMERVARRGGRCLFLAHRREIVADIANRTRALFPRVGEIMPGGIDDRMAPIQVASTQTMLGEVSMNYDLVLVDECHHYAATAWRSLTEFGVPLVGFSATPERQDGQPLSDVFTTLIRGTTYAQLVELGFIVECDIIAPNEYLGADRAAEPWDAYVEHALGDPAFVFVGSVGRAELVRAELARRGVRAAVIHENTPKPVRSQHLDGLHGGGLDVIVNVYTMTEGIDVPRARTVVLDRVCRSPVSYVQMCGRVARAYPGKDRALLIDLHGCSYVHGSPTQDRVWRWDRVVEPTDEGSAGGGPRETKEAQTLGVPMRAINAPMREPSNYTRQEPARRSVPMSKRDIWNAIVAEMRAGRMSTTEARNAYVAQIKGSR